MLNPKSFTLIELLIVIGILAILVMAIVIALNPAQLLAQARDSKRMQDLSSISSAINTAAVLDQSLVMGTSSIVYVSIPDTSATCTNLGLPTLPSGWSYHCVSATSTQNIDGTGWMPINLKTTGIVSLPAFPQDPQNTSSSLNYYTYITDGSTFKLSAMLESQKYTSVASADGGTISGAIEQGSNVGLGSFVFPSGWVRVSGNSTFGTSDFWVMKYETKCIDGTSNQPLDTVGAPYDSSNRTYYDSLYPCTAANNKYIASAAAGFPVVSITHDTAKTYCQSIGSHLLTNDEYMTIARDAERVNSNWTTGSVGSGSLYSGHNDMYPNYALPADRNDANGYAGETNVGGNQRRTLFLSNGSVVWDLAGNVHQHVQRSINNVGDLMTTMATVPACSDGFAAWGWCDQNNFGSPYVTAWTADVPQARFGPSNVSWGASQGMGKVFTFKNGVSQNTAIFFRGGIWSVGSVAGVFSLYLYQNAIGTEKSSSIGFRCAR